MSNITIYWFIKPFRLNRHCQDRKSAIEILKKKRIFLLLFCLILHFSNERITYHLACLTYVIYLLRYFRVIYLLAEFKRE